MDVHLKTLGCRLNEAEIESWAQEFQQQGHRIVDESSPDLVVLNTCAVTHSAARKSRQLIRRVQRHNPLAKLVVSGCYASLDSDQLSQDGGIDLLIDNQQKDQLVALTTEHLALQNMPQTATEPAENALFSRGRQRAFIKVQDGCRYRCTFCIVTIARGQEHSRSIDEIVSEINTLHAQGVSEVILTGVHLGGYGSDLGLSLNELIQAVLDQTDIPRIRMGSLEPWDIPDDFVKLFQNSRLMPHLHLPLQSGCDATLRRMARRCKTADYAELVHRFRKSIPEFQVTSDIIVGFPGESEEEWHQSLAFIETIGFAHLHIFSYSKRSGTKAAGLPDQVPEAVKKQRSQVLHKRASEMKCAHIQRQIGSVQPVLWEDQIPNSDGYFGYTPNYLRVQIQAPVGSDWSNQILPVRITGVNQSGDTLTAVPESDEPEPAVFNRPAS